MLSHTRCTRFTAALILPVRPVDAVVAWPRRRASQSPRCCSPSTSATLTSSVGVFDGSRLVTDFRFHTEPRATGAELGLVIVSLLHSTGLEPEAISAVAVSNVVPDLSRSIEELARQRFGAAPLVVGPGVRTGIRIHYDDPSLVGADRIANAIAAHHLYGGPAIICDFGTATTSTLSMPPATTWAGPWPPASWSATMRWLRGPPGSPRSTWPPPTTVLGRNPRASMQAGLVLGYASLVEGLVARMRSEMGGDPKLILTGGLAPLMAGLIQGVHAIDEGLTLVGLRLIHELNAA